MSATIINDIRNTLSSLADEKVREQGKRFFKEETRAYGVPMKAVDRLAADTFQSIAARRKADIFALCDDLWASGTIEESVIACDWAYRLRTQYERDDFAVFARWVHEEVGNWATCDTLCNHSVGEFIMKFPDFISQLKQWARSENRWVKRASAVTLIIPARRGLFLEDIFAIASILLEDRDDLVQKGYGWMLKAASQAHQNEVFAFVMAHKATMPRTALRYAIEKMPPERRQEAMAR